MDPKILTPPNIEPNLFQEKGKAHIILDLRWGDCGKGKAAHALIERLGARIGLRYAGGANSGHTVYPIPNVKLALNHMPCCAAHKDGVPCLGQGMVIDPKALIENEIKKLRGMGFLQDLSLPLIDELAHVVMPWHFVLDDPTGKIGSTKKGIGPAYTDKHARRGIRMVDILNAGTLQTKVEETLEVHNANLRQLALDGMDENKFIDTFLFNNTFEKLLNNATSSEQLEGIIKKMLVGYHNNLLEYLRYTSSLNTNQIVDEYLKIGEQLCSNILNLDDFLLNALENGHNIIGEGHQGVEIGVQSIEYPFVTSSDTTIGTFCAGSGIPPKYIGKIYGLIKAYDTSVGVRPGFLAKQDNIIGEKIRQNGGEFGATTGRPRDCGWLDVAATKKAIRKNGITGIVIAKLDVLTGFKEIKTCVGYELGGEKIVSLPVDFALRSRVKPIYEEHPGWRKDISGIQKFILLPKNARRFIDRLEGQFGVPVVGIGTGTGPEDMIWRD